MEKQEAISYTIVTRLGQAATQGHPWLTVLWAPFAMAGEREDQPLAHPELSTSRPGHRRERYGQPWPTLRSRPLALASILAIGFLMGRQYAYINLHFQLSVTTMRERITKMRR